MPIIFPMEKELRKYLAHNLKVERAKNSLTQEQLAELIGISPKHITKIENMKVTPSIYIVYKLARALKTNIDALLQP